MSITASSTAPVEENPSEKKPRRNNVTSTYSGLLKAVRDEGLLKRRSSFYITTFVFLCIGLVAAATGSFFIGESWFQLLIAAALGILLTQLAFIAHEASHRQVFESGPANDRAGKFVANAVVGISYQWWMNKHSRHHANPNTVGKDPDIDMDTISFLPEQAAKQKGFMAWFARRQGWLFFPLLTLEGINLHATSIKHLFQNKQVKGRISELVMVFTRLGLYLGAVFFFLPVGMAFAFIGVQLAVFGVYMGASFAPNHKGMPILPRDSKVDFLGRQVLTSRNIVGRGMNTLMGGLNYQVEHHLFPSMPRPSLARASELVKEHCAKHSIPYTETTLVQSYAIVVRYLNEVGLSARDPFDCPVRSKYRI
ncbi:MULTISPECIES: acyl-CoA desaturase [unclassified Arthrobacter]|uniref:fatty acid desaturase family protein n=1 Tax=unclassified Arthrobacter TaxID=235627 RepID=UPI001E54CA91|nr:MULTISPECIES: acyl-CoA desaturase [unclassified Arthrobacter]MCC9145625.1 acyl-CoA desaturase [Arthrobacter sp. zg-Y919]MDK1276854.1 acyl-CoA desaturase [Arthrobacter sp. zg.Y919]MDM7989492.1 acyl-CoA desaturase [Arthrobacter sp. zg-Y877]WIB04210.1 acyl-CoA desaturase [Arthrobacter sp. zg-Y919]